MLKAINFSTQTVGTSLAISISEDTCCPLSLWGFQCCYWHSAGCRMSWICLQHHATVVTSNGVTICGSQFPPTVSKHCQHQHNAIPKTTQAIWNTNNPSWCDIQDAASSIHHGSLCSQPQKILVWCLSRPANIQQISLNTIYSCIQYGHLLLTSSGTCLVCPNIKIQHYILFS